MVRQAENNWGNRGNGLTGGRQLSCRLTVRGGREVCQASLEPDGGRGAGELRLSARE